MKKFVSIMLTLAILATMASSVLAVSAPDISSPSLASGAKDAISSILGVVQYVGYAFAIGMLIYIGIKYMMSAANEKADLKKGLINYVIGAVLVAGAATIMGWLKAFGGSLTSN